MSDTWRNYTVVITIWLTITKYPYLKWQWIFYFLRRCFLSSITATTFTELTVYMCNTASVLLEAGTAYPFRAIEFTLAFFLLVPCC